MSAYSDWKCGAITYDDYRFAVMEEVRREECVEEAEREEVEKKFREED